MDRREFSRALTGAAGLTMLGAYPHSASAQSAFPSHTVTLVYPWPPGGPGDFLSRLYAQKMGPRLNQTVVVDNRPGATGAIGLSYAARAAADGYTLAVASVDTHAINPNFNEKIPYRPIDDFVSIGGIGRIPMTICVASQSAYKDAAALIAAAKAKPGTLTYSTWGTGSLAHVTMAQFARQAGIELVHVPYQGAAAALTGLLGGQVEATILPLNMAVANASAQKVTDQRIRILGTTTTKRVVAAIPTFAEQGIPMEVQNWFGIMVPAKTPAAVVDRLSRETLAVVKQQDWSDALQPQSIEAYPATAAEFRALIVEEDRRWKKVMNELNIKQA